MFTCASVNHSGNAAIVDTVTGRTFLWSLLVKTTTFSLFTISLLALSSTASAVVMRSPVVNLASGIDRSTGQLLPAGSQDANYTLTEVPAGVLPGVVALIGQHPTALADGPPVIPNSYLQGSVGSRWLGVVNSVFQANTFYLQQGNPYVIATTFSLTAPQASSALIDGLRTAVDNKLIGVRVNGTSVFNAPVAFGEEFKAFKTFQNGLGQGLFLPGLNSVEFVLDNYIAAPSPAALRVEGQVTAEIPEPSTLVLSAMFVLLHRIRRRGVTSESIDIPPT